MNAEKIRQASIRKLYKKREAICLRRWKLEKKQEKILEAIEEELRRCDDALIALGEKEPIV